MNIDQYPITSTFINDSKQLVETLNSIVNKVQPYYLEFNNDVRELKDSSLILGDIEETSYDINENATEDELNDKVNAYQSTIKYAREYFRILEKIFKSISNTYNKSIEFKELVENDKNIEMALIAILDFTNKFTHNVKDMISEIENIVKELQDKYNKIQSSSINESIGGGVSDGTFQSFGSNISKAFQLIGDMLSKGISYIGTLLGDLIGKLDVGLENIEYLNNVVKAKGWGEVFNDSRCSSTIAYAVFYCVLIYIILKVIKMILRKLSGLAWWLGR